MGATREVCTGALVHLDNMLGLATQVLEPESDSDSLSVSVVNGM